MPVLILIDGYYVNPLRVAAIGPGFGGTTRIYYSGNENDYLHIELPLHKVIAIWEEADRVVK